MGTAISKKEEQCARGKQSSDDMLSKSTDYTEDSTLPPSPGSQQYRRREVKRGSISSPDVTQSMRQRPLASSQPATGLEGPSLQRRDSDPGSPRHRSRTIPVKRRAKPLAHDGAVAQSPSEAETDEYLQRMYDSRTWEMYRRITESRKNTNYSYSHAPADGENNENTSEWENLNHDHLEAASGHEMIFLFDFD